MRSFILIEGRHGIRDQILTGLQYIAQNAEDETIRKDAANARTNLSEEDMLEIFMEEWEYLEFVNFGGDTCSMQFNDCDLWVIVSPEVICDHCGVTEDHKDDCEFVEQD